MKSRKVCIKTKSTPASLSLKGQATKHTTVKWSVGGRTLTKKLKASQTQPTHYTKSWIWHRSNNTYDTLMLLEHGFVVLTGKHISHIILLDSTWQIANKHLMVIRGIPCINSSLPSAHTSTDVLGWAGRSSLGSRWWLQHRLGRSLKKQIFWSQYWLGISLQSEPRHHVVALRRSNPIRSIQ